VELNQLEPSEIQATTVDNKITPPWPIRDLVLGMLPLFLFVSGSLILQQLKIVYFSPSSIVHPSILLYVAFYLSLMVYPYMTLKRRGTWPLITPIRPAGLVKEIVRAFGYMILIGIITGVAVKIASLMIKTDDTMAGAWEWIQSSPNEYITIPFLIFAATIGPVAEEYYFRGFLFNALKSRFPIWVALISQAFLFSIVHQYDLLGSFKIFLVGIGLAIIYQYRKTLLSPILVHCVTNALWAVPMIILTVQNHHRPAENWTEAKIQPDWFTQMSLDEIEINPKYNADAEVDFVINQLGSKGARKWKKEAIAFDAILHVFPNDRLACARAKLGLSSIYLYHLHDYRRAVIEADDLLLLYPEQKEQYALALSNKGYAFFYMNDLVQSRDAFQIVLRDFNVIDKAKENAKTGLEWIDRIENRKQ
jgi:membrane protease YdiL (CAAX protease family)